MIQVSNLLENDTSALKSEGTSVVSFQPVMQSEVVQVSLLHLLNAFILGVQADCSDGDDSFVPNLCQDETHIEGIFTFLVKNARFRTGVFVWNINEIMGIKIVNDVSKRDYSWKWIIVEKGLFLERNYFIHEF